MQKQWVLGDTAVYFGGESEGIQGVLTFFVNQK